ncbi:hypothetical protein [Streptomyces malaysiense]|uniref:Uncharacterized protein n=1 Tax=Streptomyces malaysiense TaxID=1428626 RepID=A0A1J4PZS8_9ACTN|nr:hypothetical protein [Streptomyces malaysiense]OIK25455.1 hypothetical protein VT52_021520 [Streptomyces malaysiense]
MRSSPPPPRRIVLPALSALLLFVPALWPSAQPASADTGSVSLLYDPGPSHDCYSLVVEHPPDKNTTPDPARTSSAGCGAFAATEEFTRKSRERFTWDIGTYGWNTSDWGTSPGYSFVTRTAAKTVTMRNDAVRPQGRRSGGRRPATTDDTCPCQLTRLCSSAPGLR